jgi:hypothetical protein
MLFKVILHIKKLEPLHRLFPVRLLDLVRQKVKTRARGESTAKSDSGHSAHGNGPRPEPRPVGTRPGLKLPEAVGKDFSRP